MDFFVWAVLGSPTCGGKRLNPLKYATFEGSFYGFMGKMNKKIDFLYIVASALKNWII
jgi:hypothetical protein